MSKINAWSKSNKQGFNEAKSKILLISRRKTKEAKEIKIYLNDKPIKQDTTTKYLGIVIDDKFKFSQHISHSADKRAKLIFSLSKFAKIHWGLNHEDLITIYKEAILPLLLYGAPVWIDALMYEYNRRKYITVQRIINIPIAKHIALRPAKLYAFWQEPHQSSSKLKKQPSATAFEKDTERTYRRLTEKLDSINGRTLLTSSTS